MINDGVDMNAIVHEVCITTSCCVSVGNIYYVRSLSAKFFLLKTTSACGIAEIVKTFRIKGMHVVEMNAAEEEFCINIFEIAGFMATVISFNRKSTAIAGFMVTAWLQYYYINYKKLYNLLNHFTCHLSCHLYCVATVIKIQFV